MASNENPVTGQPVELPEDFVRQMEDSFDTDFSSVKVYTECSDADTQGAAAYTQGESIYIAPGRYNPNSTDGQELLAHELTHVVQQREGQRHPDKCPQADAEAHQCSKLAVAKKKIMRALGRK